MSKFNFIKKKAFAWFEKNDATTSKKENNLNQPSEIKSKADLTPEDRKNKKNKLLKKLLILFLSLSVLAIIVVPIIISCTRKTEIALSNNVELVTTNSDGSALPANQIGLKDTTNKSTYLFDVSKPETYVATYYRSVTAGNARYEFKLKPINSTLPIAVKIQITSSQVAPNQPTVYEIKFGTNPTTYRYIDGTTDASTQTEFLKQLSAQTQDPSAYPTSFNWLGLITSLLPTILLITLFAVYFSMMKKGMGGGQDSIFGMGKTSIKSTKTNVKFIDVAGINEVKDELKEIVDYVQNSTKYAAMGARAPKGIVLYGPPGTGKTLIAKAVAGEANCNFFPTSGSAFEDMLVGVGAKRVRDLFSKARKAAPSIIFIDEIDSVAAKRGKNDIVGGGSGVADQTINQLLAEMDGFSTDAGVIVIAATNRLDVLDEAILRPGRFDRQIQVTLPDIKGREEILKIHSRNKNISSEVNLLDIARRTPGFSGAQLENVLNEAAILAVRNNKIVIKTHDIDEAIDRVIGGPARHGRVISDYEKKQIAYHEAGHALVGLHSTNTEVVQKITIIPRGDAAGYTMQTPAEQEKVIQTKEDLLNQIRMTLGGRAAEEIIYGPSQITTGASNDLYKVSQIVKAMVLSLGMSKMGLTQYVPSEGNTSPLQQKMYSETTARELDLEIEGLIQKEYANAKKIIESNRKELDLIVETLLVLETIVKSQIDYIHENLKLPPEVKEMRTKMKDSNKLSLKEKDKESKQDTQEENKDKSKDTNEGKTEEENSDK